MSNILVVEDEIAMAQGLKHNLEFEGHQVTIAGNGRIGLDKIHEEDFDLVLLDVMMPELSGFDVLKTVRSEGNKVPIIMLTAKSEEIDKVLGLEMGADDFVTKPFSIRELLARIKAILRRSDLGPAAVQDVFHVGKLRIDFSSYTASTDGEPVHLSVREFDILKYLLDKKGDTVSRGELLENIWGYESTPTTRTVDNFILRLRQKIEPDELRPTHIITVHGLGYKLIMN